MELHIWAADFGLPSFDVSCLQFLACSKMCASPIVVVPSVAPWNSPNGEFPCVFDREKNEATTDFEKFVELLRKNGQDVVIDAELTAAERTQLDAFGCYLQQNLYPAVLHTLWIDELNYTTITQHWYSSRLCFPYNLYYIEKRRKRAYRLLKDKPPEMIYKDALEALNMLSAKLGDNKFMCGNKPSSLDALAFGYLAPLLRLPLPNDRLQLHLSALPNLARFVESVTSIYLPLSDEQIRQQRNDRKVWEQRRLKAERTKQAEKNAPQEPNQTEQEMPLRDTILFAVGALTLSVLFAVHSGIIQVVVEEEDEVITGQ